MARIKLSVHSECHRFEHSVLQSIYHMIDSSSNIKSYELGQKYDDQINRLQYHAVELAHGQYIQLCQHVCVVGGGGEGLHL